MKDAVIYQIFPDRFRNGNTGDDYNGRVVYGANTCNGYSGAGGPAYGNADTLMLGEVTGGGQPSGIGYLIPAELDSMMNLISSHDSPRMKSLLGEDTARLKFGVIAQMTLPGAPSVYYGDEVGMSGNGESDQSPAVSLGGQGRRARHHAVCPFQDPDRDSQHPPRSARRRAQHPASRQRGGMYSYLRSDTVDRIVVALNNTGSAGSATIPVSGYLADGTVLTDVLNGGTLTVSGRQIVAPVNTRWGRILVAGTPALLPRAYLPTVVR